MQETLYEVQIEDLPETIEAEANDPELGVEAGTIANFSSPS